MSIHPFGPGFSSLGVNHNLSYEQLVEHEQRLHEGTPSDNGTMMVDTGVFTGRSPNDKYFVRESSSQDNLWWGSVNRPVTQEVFDELLTKVKGSFHDRETYVVDGYVGADERFAMPIRIITQRAWQAHFARNMFIRPSAEQLEGFEPEFVLIDSYATLDEDFQAHGLNSQVFIIFNLARKLAIIGGTEYGGEIKKGLFSVMNYYLPLRDILTMHCSANVGPKGDVALFFGLSGTGKTTLSTDPDRKLIGDDEHGWSEKGVFNLEGGCYAKCIDLDPRKEPGIYNAIRPPGALLENVAFDPASRKVDYTDGSKTENTRVSYPIDLLANSEPSGQGDHPRNIIFLTCDAFGVLPPVARLTPGKAMYYFLSGYTAKVAGTERGVREPQAVFSACFGEPFLTLHPTVYANQMMNKIYQHGASAWLVNTGWTSGPYGVGKRIALSTTRRIISAILNGELNNVNYHRMPVFCLDIPYSVPGVEPNVLDPVNTWSDKVAFHRQVDELARLFRENFHKYASEVTEFDYAAFGPQMEPSPMTQYNIILPASPGSLPVGSTLR